MKKSHLIFFILSWRDLSVSFSCLKRLSLSIIRFLGWFCGCNFSVVIKSIIDIVFLLMTLICLALMRKITKKSNLVLQPESKWLCLVSFSVFKMFVSCNYLVDLFNSKYFVHCFSFHFSDMIRYRAWRGITDIVYFKTKFIYLVLMRKML